MLVMTLLLKSLHSSHRRIIAYHVAGADWNSSMSTSAPTWRNPVHRHMLVLQVPTEEFFNEHFGMPCTLVSNLEMAAAHDIWAVTTTTGPMRSLSQPCASPLVRTLLSALQYHRGNKADKCRMHG
jgi:hypothetical protein